MYSCSVAKGACPLIIRDKEKNGVEDWSMLCLITCTVYEDHANACNSIFTKVRFSTILHRPPQL